jgi:hypothetical protein
MPDFQARLEAGGHKDAWVRIQVPFDVEEAFGTRGRVSVTCRLNGKPFQTSIFPNGDGTHHMLVNKTMQVVAGVAAGDRVKVRMTRDTGAETKVPDDLTDALEGNGRASKAFDGLTAAGRREYIAWIEAAKRPETRAGRVKKTMEMVLAGKRRPSE